MAVPSNTERALGTFKYKRHIKVADIEFWWCDCAVRLSIGLLKWPDDLKPVLLCELLLLNSVQNTLKHFLWCKKCNICNIIYHKTGEISCISVQEILACGVHHQTSKVLVVLLSELPMWNGGMEQTINNHDLLCCMSLFFCKQAKERDSKKSESAGWRRAVEGVHEAMAACRAGRGDELGRPEELLERSVDMQRDECR